MTVPFDISSALQTSVMNFNREPLIPDARQTTTGVDPEDIIVTRWSSEITIDRKDACHFLAKGALFVPHASLEKIHDLPKLFPKWPGAQQIFTGVEFQRVVSQVVNPTDSSFVLHQATGSGSNEMQYTIQLDAFKQPHGYVFKQQLVPTTYTSHLQEDGKNIKAAGDVLITSNGKTEILLARLQNGDEIISGALIFIQFESDMLRESPSTGKNMMTAMDVSCETAVGNGFWGATAGTVAHHIEERLENIAGLIQEED